EVEKDAEVRAMKRGDEKAPTIPTENGLQGRDGPSVENREDGRYLSGGQLKVRVQCELRARFVDLQKADDHPGAAPVFIGCALIDERWGIRTDERPAEPCDADSNGVRDLDPNVERLGHADGRKRKVSDYGRHVGCIEKSYARAKADI